jgi:hypothetical protein
MHPLVSRIHPSYRTAFFAWFVTRSLLWMTAAASGRATFVGARVFEDFGGGTPAWSLLIHGLSLLGDAAPIALAALAELALLAACVAVYRFVRRDQLPQTAESAAWLWAASPAMVFTLPAGDWTFAVALSAIALGALSDSRHIAAGIALSVAVAFRPEAVLLWPGVAFLGLKNYQPGKQPPISPWITGLGPLAAFIGAVLAAMSLAGRFGVSLRTLQSGNEWRDGIIWNEFAWAGFSAHSADFLMLAALIAGLAMASAFLRQVPKSWPLLALPCLIAPLFFQLPSPSIAALLLALPFYGYLGRLAADPVVERPLLAASLGGLLVTAIGL